MTPRATAAIAAAALVAAPVALGGAAPPDKSEAYGVLVIVTYTERQELRSLLTPLPTHVTAHTDGSDHEMKLKWRLWSEGEPARLTRTGGRLSLTGYRLTGTVDAYSFSHGREWRLAERSPPGWTTCTSGGVASLDDDFDHDLSGDLSVRFGDPSAFFGLKVGALSKVRAIGGEKTTCSNGLSSTRGPASSLSTVEPEAFLPTSSGRQRLLDFPARGIQFGHRIDRSNRFEREIDVTKYFPNQTGTWTKTWTLELHAVPCSKLKTC